MREILFRGKRTDNGEWVYGGYIHKKHADTYIITSTIGISCKNEINNMIVTGISVNHDTVGQHTGLTDKNGVKIFEGDVVRECYKNCDIEEFRYNIGKVFYCEKAARFLLRSRRFPDCYADMSIYKEYEVIGNIHDNPELLKGEENV